VSTVPICTIQTNKLLDHFSGKTALSPTPLPVWVGVSSTTPVIAGTGATEPSTGSYARVATTGSTWNASSSGSVTNAAAITFPTATADWLSAANLTYGLLWDASTAGNLVAFGLLSVAKNCQNGDTVSIAIGSLTISLS
jgi:hypothetical protein